jgi:S-(hydroxymethyl)glutathione dehydrogenase/alcohol dehydrogenase
MPVIGGHEGAGVVTKVGPGVVGIEEGDHVILAFVPACGKCPSCATGHQNLCDMGQFLLSPVAIADNTYRVTTTSGEGLGRMCQIGTFSPYVTVHEASVVKVENDIPLDKACLIGCGVTTGWGSSVYAAKVQPGDTVVVVGIGGIGAAALQGARLAGASKIVAVDPVEFKREQAMQLGATHTASDMDEAFKLVTDITWGRMADKAILTVGVVHGDMVAPAMSLVSKNGRVVVTGISPFVETDVKLSLFELAMFQKELVGTIFGSANPRADIPKLCGLYRDGQLLLDEMVTRTYKLEDINQGYQDMLDAKNIRGVIVYD